jgi:hypothetical protein
MFNLEFTISGNPDRSQGDWEEKHVISAPTINELRADVLKFQGENDIGGGNWGEAILRQDGNLVGYMSYNGRVWSKPYWESGAVEVNIS